jgi:bifunctional UDP-N-acetylglucosamine pyrophosphorylase/glucosamine-1-phosphate N-acetyltransferase
MPKVLRRVGGGALLECVVRSLSKVPGLDGIMVVGSSALFSCAYWPEVARNLSEFNARFVEQPEPLGTGHATQVAMGAMDGAVERVLVCCGDVPLIQPENFAKVLHDEHDIALLAARLSSPEQSTYGRLVLCKHGSGVGRDSRIKCVAKIVEVKEATEEQRKIDLANVGVYGFSRKLLGKVLPSLPQRREIYLTDVIELACSDGADCVYYEVGEKEATGVDTSEALCNVNLFFKELFIKRAIDNGVVFQDFQTFQPSFDTEIAPNCEIGAFNVCGRGVVIEEGARILPFCFLEDCVIRRGSTVGPFARIRGGSEIGEGVCVGNFVEVKKSFIGNRSKMKHLSYIGDASVGANVNVGAGTITCNYDGRQKHETVIEDDASVGANVALVAPVKIGKGAVIGAGSVITKDVPAQTLALTRSPQKHNTEWIARKSSIANHD